MGGDGLRVAWYRTRATFGAQWPGLLALALLLALMGGLAMGAVEAARTTDSSFTDFSASTHVPDFFVFDGVYNPQFGLDSAYNPALLRTLATLPHVTRVESYVALNAGLLSANSTPDPASEGVTGTATVNGLDFNEDTVVVTQGRMLNPKRADEMVMDDATARVQGVHLGQVVRIGWFNNVDASSPGLNSLKAPASQQLRVKVVGLGAIHAESLFEDQDSAQAAGIELFSPALTSKLLRCCSSDMVSGLTVAGGSRNVAAVEREVRAVLPKGLPFIAGATSQAEARGARTLRPEAIALAVFGGIAALATLLIAGQMISRRIRLRVDEFEVLRALGAAPATIAADGLLGVMAAVAVGTLLAAAVAVALSPLGPLGPVSPLVPTALHPDWAVIGVGLVMLLAVLEGLALITAGRAQPHRLARRLQPPRLSRAVQLAAGAGLPAPAVTGIRFALEPGTGRTSVPVRSAILGAIVAVVVVVSTITFGSSLSTLISHPSLYGWNWTDAIDGGGGIGDIPGHAAATLLDHDRYVAAWTGVYFSNLAIDGQLVPVLGGTPHAAVGPALLSGQGLEASNQIVLGASTMAQLHKQIGDTVTVKGAHGLTTLRIVGSATMPAIGVAASAHLEMGVGALLSSQLIPAAQRNIFNGTPGPNEILVTMKQGADPTKAFASLVAIGQKVQLAGNGGQIYGVERPAEILNYQSLGTTPALLGISLAAGAVAALGLTLVASVRRRRSDLALLKTLGFRRRQLAATISWQASVAVGTGCVVGIPLGIALGRVLWTLFARGINAVPDPVVPWGWVLLIAVVAMLLANLVAAAPGRLAAHTDGAPARSRVALVAGPRPRAGAHPELLPEEGEGLIERGPGGRALLVDQVLGQHRVCHLGMPVGVARAGVDLHRNEGVTQLAAQRLEALGKAERVVGEAQPQEALPGGGPLLDLGQVGVGDADVRLALLAERERQGGLAQHGGQHDVIHHHGQGEAAREAHADRTDPGPTAALVLSLGQRAQPDRDRAGRFEGQVVELA